MAVMWERRATVSWGSHPFLRAVNKFQTIKWTINSKSIERMTARWPQLARLSPGRASVGLRQETVANGKRPGNLASAGLMPAYARAAVTCLRPASVFVGLFPLAGLQG